MKNYQSRQKQPNKLFEVYQPVLKKGNIVGQKQQLLLLGAN